MLLQDNSEKLQAYTYVWSDSTDTNLYGEWDLEVDLLSFIFLLQQITDLLTEVVK